MDPKGPALSLSPMDSKPRVILDSNVLLAFLLDEPEQALAAKLFQEHDQQKLNFFVPSLWDYEIWNRLSRVEKSLFNTGYGLFLRFTNLPTKIDLNRQIIDQALLISSTIPQLAFYDTVYHALAMIMDGTFLTLDQKYYEKTKALKHIKLLRDYHV